MNTTGRIAAIVALSILALNACASDEPSAAQTDTDEQAGSEPAPVTITIGDSQPPNRPSNVPLVQFAAEVESASGGSLRVEIITDFGAPEAAGEGSDEEVIAKVRSGELQMAVVPARAWSASGVESMRPLQLPLLMESDQHVNSVVEDAAIVTSLFKDLDDLGVRGVTMFPESLRHLYSYTSPILSPIDMVGRHVRYLSAPDVARIITTLGATPVNTSGDDYATMVADGTITAFDSGFTIAKTSNPQLATATGNLVLYSKVITFVANTSFWDALSDEQRDAVNDAAISMQGWAISHRVGERSAAAKYCADGGTVVLTDPESIDEFRDVMVPIYTEARQNASTAETIDAIEALAKAKDFSEVEACTPPTGVISADDIVADGGELPNGVYQAEYTDEFLAAHGMNPSDIEGNHGTWTFRLEDGTWTFDTVTPEGVTDNATSRYQVDGDIIYWRFHQTGEGFIALRWSTDEDGTLHFTQVQPTDPSDFQFDLPWQRIGDL